MWKLWSWFGKTSELLVGDLSRGCCPLGGFCILRRSMEASCSSLSWLDPCLQSGGSRRADAELLFQKFTLESLVPQFDDLDKVI